MTRATLAIAALLSLLAVTATSSSAKDEHGKWMKLGTRTVDFKVDHDTIDVGKAEGRFTHIRLNVEKGDLLMEKIKVTFGNGDTFEPKMRLEFKEGTRSHSIELPAHKEGRLIKKVDFVYRSEHKRDPATIVLFAQEK